VISVFPILVDPSCEVRSWGDYRAPAVQPNDGVRNPACLRLPKPVIGIVAPAAAAHFCSRKANNSGRKRRMIRGIHHIAVHCRDLDRMIRFYRQAFGFEVVGEKFAWADVEIVDRLIDVPGSAARGAMLRAGTCYMELFEFQAPAGETRPRDPQDKGYTHMCIDVTDIDAEYERLKGLGMKFGHPHPIDMGHVKSVYGRDPEGNVIEIQETAAVCDFRLDRLAGA
jgi:catechol 2,3-dioxygenase-like lactoylglutathione lyase family enzyme